MTQKASSNRKFSALLFAVPVFFSGFACLIYELLWLKQLSLLFGNTAYASSVTLCAFFSGMAAGGYYWGEKSKTISNSLKTYAALELGIAFSALLFFILFKLYYLIYSPLFNFFGHRFFLFLSVKFLLSLILMFLPCFFMGGTFPIIANAYVRQKEDLGRKASFLYAINTLGAAFGAFATSFYLILNSGIKNSYFIAVCINIAISLYIYLLSRTPQTGYYQDRVPVENRQKNEKKIIIGQKPIFAFAFFSGFLTLCLEVLWIRMFALVLQNSVYSFGAVVITFIISLALGSFLANRLCRINIQPVYLLCFLLTICGFLAGFSPTVFYKITNGLDYMAGSAGWWEYIITVFKNAVIVIVLPGIIIGSVFPYLLKISQGAFKDNSGSIIGKLSCINTIGAAIGSAATGFILLEVLGLWKSVLFVAMIYCAMAVSITFFIRKRRLLFCISPIIIAVLLFTVLNPCKFPLIQVDYYGGEELSEIWEGAHGSTAVVKDGENLSLVVDNYYLLGDLSDLIYERMQGHMPLILHPKPEKVLFIGMGTGITAGASLFHPVSSVTTCELIPEVIHAAKKYFTPFVNGLFDNPKSRIIAEDGRNFLLGNRQQYDVIISDLFIPWGAGTGSMYSLEYYRTACSRLKKRGIFAQWLPLYQLSKREFMIIAKTMLQVFPQLTLWRGDFYSTGSIVVLIGQKEKKPLNPQAIVNRMRCLAKYKNESEDFIKATILLFYAGNLSENRQLFKNVKINTDNRPLIEYLSPVTHRKEEEKKVKWFESHEMLQFCESLFARIPPEEDPYLELFAEDEAVAAKAGLTYYKGAVFEEDRKLKKANSLYMEFFSFFPEELSVELEKKGFQYISE